MTVPPSPYPASAPIPDGTPAPDDSGMPGPVGATPPRPGPGQDLGADLGAALRFASSALLRNWVSFLVVGLVYCLVITVLLVGGFVGGVVAMFPMLAELGPSEEPPLEATLLFLAIFYGAALLSAPFFLLWQSGSARAAEVVLEGGRPRLGQAVVGPLRIILTALLVGAITLVGMLLLYIPGLIASVLLIFAVPAAARGASPVAALRQSVSLVRNNLATSIVTYLVIGIIGSIAGSLVVTVLALVPFLLLFELGMFERLNGRELPEPARA